MDAHFLRTLAVSAALLLGTSAISSQALDLNLGGGGGSGTPSVAIGGSDSPVSLSVGGGNNVASASVNAGGQKADVSISNSGGGPLAVVDSKGDRTSGAVNLGGLLGRLGNIDVPGIGGGSGGGNGGGGGGGGPSPGKVNAVLAGMSGGDQAQARLRCRNILYSPGVYDNELVQLCRILLRVR